MVVLALAMRDAGELASNTLVTTVMSNLGLHLAMRAAGIEVRTTSVGDRYVLEELRAGEYSLGGEQSGHIVHADPRHHRRRHRHGAAADVADGADPHRRWPNSPQPMHTLPQVLINVAVADKATVADAPSVRTAVAEAEARAGRHRPNPVAAVRNRASGPRDGGSRRRGHRAACSRSASRSRSANNADGGNRTGPRSVLTPHGSKVTPRASTSRRCSTSHADTTLLPTPSTPPHVPT